MRKNIILAIFMAMVCHCNLFAATVIEKHWNCDPSLYPNTMTIVGVVEIDEAEQGNTSLEVGAFCGTECRGSEMLRSFPQVNRFLVFLTVYGEDNDALTFKLYDHGTREELDAYVEGMTFTINGMHGTPVEPYEFNFIPYYTVTAAVNPSGTGSISGAGHFVAHSSMSLTAMPNTGYGFVNWTENGEEVGTEPTLQFELLGNRSLVANFEMIMHHVDVGVNFDVAGSATGAGDFQEGSTVNVLATPNTGFLFDRWSENGQTVSTSASYAFAIWEDRDLTAEFKLAITDTTASSCAEYEWHGQTYTSSGTYYDTMTSYLGIDSIVALHLTIYPAYAFNLYETACDSYLWNGTYYYESGDYEDAYQTIHGCDSIYTLHLTINQTRPLGNFTYMTPANNYVNRYTDVDFYWDGVVNADRYDFYFWEDGNDRPTNPTIANSTSVTAHRNGLEHGVTYHWCVVAKNECVEMESAERTFVCQLTPSMTVIPQSSLDFGEVEVGQSSTKSISVSGTALPEDISYAFLENEYGADAEFFAVTPSSNWNALKGGTLQVTFTPVADQLYYNSAIRIASSTFVDTVYLTGSMANRFIFTTHVEESRSQFVAGDTIVINGHVEDVLGNVVPNLDVDVYMMVMGTRTTKRTVSDENGDYSITYVPRYSESGYYQVGSCEKNKRSTEVHDTFDVPGISRTSNDYIKWELYQNDTITGAISIRNRSRIPLGNITITPISLPEGGMVEFGELSLDALETSELHYSVVGTQVTTGNNYQEAVFALTATDGTTMNLACYYYCHRRRGDLEVYPSSISTTMKRNAQKMLSFQITNNGNGETGTISINTPDMPWMRVVGADTLPSIAVGDSVTFSLMLEPDENVYLSQYTGNLAVNCSNGNGVSIPYTIEASSDSTGVLIVDVTDDYTYNTNNGNGPHLAGASVTVMGYYSLQTVASGYTDTDGIFRVDSIPEGYYYLTIRAQYHSEINKNIIYIEGGKTNNQVLYMQFQPISYSWDVTPTEIEDEYEFTLVTEIKTNVPVPVVVIEGPSVFDSLAYGDTLHYNLTVSNRGLVDAYDTQINIVADFDEYVFTPLFDFIDTIHPHSHVIVPCIMTRVQGGRNTGPNSDLCLNGMDMSYSWYHCNAKKKWVEHKREFNVRSKEWCKDHTQHNAEVKFPEIDDLDEMPPLPSWIGSVANFGNNLITVANSIKSEPVETISQDCTPCWQIAASLIMHAVQAYTGLPVADAWDFGVAIGNKIDELIRIKESTRSSPLSIITSLYSYFLDAMHIHDLNVYRTETIDYFEHLNSAYPGVVNYADFSQVEYSREFDKYMTQKKEYGLAELDSYYNTIPTVYNTIGSLSSFIDQLRHCITFTDPNRDNSEIDMIINHLEQSVSFYQSFYDLMINNILKEEEWMEEEHLLDFLDNFMMIVDTTNYLVSPQDEQQLIETTVFSTVNDSIVHSFVNRWNRSIQYWDDGFFTISDLPDGFDSNFIQLDSTIILPAVEALENAQAYGFDNVSDMFHAAFNTIFGVSKSHSNDVCAKVSVQFKQTMAMTREAFEGTLRITNGHMTDPMQDIAVNLTIKNPSGEDCTNLFQINTTSMDQITGIDGTGSLDAQTEGVVQFMMIPTIAAAPDTTVVYSFGGSFTFLDPFSGEEMTYQLYPVDLKVYPGPNLYVDYFVQRNIISDDPLTEDIIEPMEEAEIAMMIRNLGAGDAKNVFLESSQPTIIENQNNLLISFDMTGAAMNGERRPLGLTDVPFGTITSHTNGIAEWYFTSSLIGRVINSNARVIHNNSYGNPQLSLVSSVNTHELIKAVSAYGALDDGINDFLVNEITDFGHLPDKLYFSNGDTTNVIQADSIRALDSVTHLNHTVVMEMYPHAAGWNYGSMEDPGQGRYELVSCTRSDGQVIPLNNVWITHVTIPHDDIPVHENMLHIVDTLATGDMTTYTLVYDVELYCDITVTVAPEEGGTATGEGRYDIGATVALEALPNEGYSFVSWTEADAIVSTDASFELVALTDRNLVANFSLNNYQITATANPTEGGTVTGAGNYDHGAECTLTATPAEGYTFLNWTKDGEVVSTEAFYSFTVTEAGDYVGNFGYVMDQTFALEQGWNWWSSYIDLEGTGLTQLEEGLSEHGLYIKSLNNGFVGKDGEDWYGTLRGLHNQNMYMIQTNAPVQVTMSGVCVNASQLEMNTAVGWNWIGYPLTSAQSVDNALTQLDANDGDVLKTMNKMSVFDVDGWYGSLRNMNPGQGYMFYSEQTHNFIYGTSRGRLEEEPNWMLHWNSKARQYENSMAFVATVAMDGEELQSEAYELAAFCNGTSLGSTRLLYNARRNRYYALLPVPGEEGMKLDFKLYDADLGCEYPDQAKESYSFVVNGINGSLDEPVVLHFGSKQQEGIAIMQLYPNPVKKDGIVRLSLPETTSPVRVEIYNVIEVLVTTKVVTGNSFNIGNNLPSGTYILRAYDGKEKVYYGKLIIE